ncbi:MAG: orotidine-5'-phosphate decarboxylase [Flavobacteriales bacterium]|nr:orotidine-5'-phosphate decarboxylase [Flavobacteriales bacterium]
MRREQLVANIRNKKSFLCVGLDPVVERIPAFLNDFEDPIFEFNKRIIDATKDYCVAYKPNIAFYEALGLKGWESLEKTVNYIPDSHFKIADAKRADIGNTSKAYAKAFFETLPFDAITIAPYMGEDSITPFLEYENKWVIILGLTSNKGSKDFQLIQTAEGQLYEKVLTTCSSFGDDSNIMFVVGATQTNQMQRIREIIPNHFLLIPGIGAQGGDLKSTVEHTINKDVGILINSSRSIIYADHSEKFDEFAKNEALSLQKDMSDFLRISV